MKRTFLSIVLLMSLLGAMLIAPSTYAFSDVDGIWLSHGYGMLFEISGGQAVVYDITPISCTPLFEQEVLDYLGVQLTLENGELVVLDSGTLLITAARLDALPDLCTNGGTVSDDPELNFEAFWHDFNDNYAFFDLHGVDWQAQYDLYRPQVTASTTPDELFAILSEMISPLDDDHTSLESDHDEFSPALAPTWDAAEDSELVVLLSTLDVIAENYLGGTVTFNPLTFSIQGDEALILNRMMFFGVINDRVGYVNILGEGGYVEEGDDLAAAEAAMDQAIAAFAGLNAVIVDIRLNVGGDDAIALALASRFADQTRLAWSEHTRDGSEFTPWRELYVEPGGPQQFTGSVYVLTTPYTVSAGETFLLAMDELPHVTVIGERTAGAYSDALPRTLPNGWTFTLSNEVYLTAGGTNYEKTGNPPDIDVVYDLAAFETGTDTMIEAALEMAAQ